MLPALLANPATPIVFCLGTLLALARSGHAKEVADIEGVIETISIAIGSAGYCVPDMAIMMLRAENAGPIHAARIMRLVQAALPDAAPKQLEAIHTMLRQHPFNTPAVAAAALELAAADEAMLAARVGEWAAIEASVRVALGC